MRRHQVLQHLLLPLVLAEMGLGLFISYCVHLFDGLCDCVCLVEDLGLKQIEYRHGFVRSELLTLSHTVLQIFLQDTFVLCFQLCQQMWLDVLNFTNFYLCHTLLHLPLDVAQTRRATHRFVLSKKVFEVGSDPELDISGDLN